MVTSICSPLLLSYSTFFSRSYLLREARDFIIVLLTWDISIPRCSLIHGLPASELAAVKSRNPITTMMSVHISRRQQGCSWQALYLSPTLSRQLSHHDYYSASASSPSETASSVSSNFCKWTFLPFRMSTS